MSKCLYETPFNYCSKFEGTCCGCEEKEKKEINYLDYCSKCMNEFNKAVCSGCFKETCNSIPNFYRTKC